MGINDNPAGLAEKTMIGALRATVTTNFIQQLALQQLGDIDLSVNMAATQVSSAISLFSDYGLLEMQSYITRC